MEIKDINISNVKSTTHSMIFNALMSSHKWSETERVAIDIKIRQLIHEIFDQLELDQKNSTYIGITKNGISFITDENRHDGKISVESLDDRIRYVKSLDLEIEKSNFSQNITETEIVGLMIKWFLLHFKTNIFSNEVKICLDYYISRFKIELKEKMNIII